MSQLDRSIVPDFVIQKLRQEKFFGEFKAATLFVDISGFTSLTETFLMHHREGAEALTNVLRQIFSPQIEVLTQRGGFIPFFAGDAFLAIFPYDDPESGNKDAPVHALKTAFEIQNYFRYDGTHRLINTRHGTFGFGVKIGLSFGDVSWGIPGEPGHYAFYFRGEAIEGCARAQERAATGEIVADRTILDFWETDVIQEALDEPNYARLLEENASSLALHPPEFNATLEEIQQFIPEQIVHLTVNEFREVCTIFISFEAPEETELFHQFIVETDRRIRHYGGYLNQIDIGDKGCLLVILFGAPIAYENNLLRAAGFVQQMVNDDVLVQWRAGMTYGLLWAGIRGGSGRSEYGVVGNEINLAARLAMTAEWNQVIVTDLVYRHLKDAYLFYALGKKKIKGKSEPASLYLFNHRYDSVDFHDYQGNIIGRAEEINHLEQIAHDVFQNKRAQLVYIHGDVGVGKTRLIFEMRRKILYRYFPQTFYCSADEIQQTSLNPFKRFLRSYFSLKPDQSEEENKEAFFREYEYLLSQLPDAHPDSDEIREELKRTRTILGAMTDLYWSNSLYEQLEPKLRFENMLHAFKNLLKAAALIRPVILHLEDAQWLDDDSLKLLDVLSHGLETYPILFVCTSRYKDDGSRTRIPLGQEVPSVDIDLDKLSFDAVLEMAQSYLNATIVPEVAQFLVAKTDGNPFFVEQLLQDLRERNAFTPTNDGTKLDLERKTFKVEELPTTINTLLLSRLDRLAYEVKQVVRSASVLGSQFQYSVLQAMLPEHSNLQSLVHKAEEQQIWFDQNDGSFQFKHALLRDAAYAMQLKSNIRKKHRSAASAIKQVHANDLAAHYVELAFHSDKGERYDEAVKWYQLAGEQAASRYANSEALTYLDRALSLLRTVDKEREFDIRLVREEILGTLGERQAQENELAQLLKLAEHASNIKKLAVVAYRQAKFSEVTGEYQNALQHAEKAAAVAKQTHDTHHMVASYILRGKLFYRLGDYAQAHLWLKEGLAQAQINEMDSFEADSLRQIGIVFVDENRLEEAKKHYEYALSIYRDVGDKMGMGTTLNNMGVVYWNSADLLQAQTYYNEAMTIYNEIGNRRGKNMVRMNLGLLISKYGRFSEAISYFEQASTELTEINERFGLSFVHLSLAATYNMLSDFDRAHEHGRFVYQLADEIGARRIVGLALMEIGRALVGKRKIYGAEKAFLDAFQLWEKMNQSELIAEVRTGLAYVYILKDDEEAAREAISLVLTFFEENATAEDRIEGYLLLLFTTYKVLKALEDPRADQVVQKMFMKLREKSEKISDANIRHSFVNDVPLHAQIIELAHKRHTLVSPRSTPLIERK